jgi:hypothetical protein
MIRLHSHYSKKVPGSIEFSSEHFSASMEIEVADEIGRNTEKLQSSLSWLWGELKQAIETQIQQSFTSQPKQKSLPYTNPKTPPSSNQNPQFSKSSNQKSNGGKASNKQVKFLIQLSKRQGYDFQALGGISQEQFGKNSVYELSISEASSLIDHFKGE